MATKPQKVGESSVVVDQNGFIIAVNTAFEHTFQWKAQDLVGQLVTAIIPESLRDGHHLGFSRFLTTEKSNILNQSLDLEILTGSGLIKKARHFISAQKKGKNWVFEASLTLLKDS